MNRLKNNSIDIIDEEIIKINRGQDEGIEIKSYDVNNKSQNINKQIRFADIDL